AFGFFHDLLVGNPANDYANDYGLISVGVTYSVAIVLPVVGTFFIAFGLLEDSGYLPRLAILGVAIGLVGVAVLVWPTGAGANAFDGLGILVLLAAPIGWSHGSLFSAHRARLPRNGIMASGLQMLAGAGVLAVEGLVTGEVGQLQPEAITLRSLLALAYLTVIGSMVAFTAYAWLLRHAPLSLVGTYAYVNPIVAVGLGAAFLSEPISARTLVAAAVIVAAVAMIVTARGRVAGRLPEEVAPGGLEEPATPPPSAAPASVPTLSSNAPRRAPSD
ncbi:MAG TPA: EamA family transporter, partial [Candidatus Limnocylindrales bacterium]|nr:EamA family transporter [Candidatus Limnocylindrales bacterium]